MLLFCPTEVWRIAPEVLSALFSVPITHFAVSPTSVLTLASVFSSSCCDPVISSMYFVFHPLEPPRGYETHWGMHGQCCAVLARRGCVPSASVTSRAWVPCDTGCREMLGRGSHLHLQGDDHLDSQMCAQPVRRGYWWKAAWDTSALLMG